MANAIPRLGVIVKAKVVVSVINLNRLTIIGSRMVSISSIWVSLSGASLGSVFLNKGGAKHP